MQNLKELVMIPNAGHLFEEEGAIEQVAELLQNGLLIIYKKRKKEKKKKINSWSTQHWLIEPCLRLL